jgi:hypothetical protein
MIWIRRYHDLAFRLESWAGSDTLLHICAGLAIWLLSSLALKRPMRDVWTLLPVALAEGGNEVCDYVVHIGWTLSDTLHDIVATLVWPIVLQQYMSRWRR